MKGRRILPSLTSLQCFEAATRHMSFTRAARELNITQGAVSRQVRQLEEFVGRPLFERVKKRLVLTDAGAAYAKAVKDVLDRAEAATLQVMAQGDAGGELTIALLPTFGTRWLVPRLGDFAARYPDIQLSLVTKLGPFDFEGSGIDAAVHFGSDVWPGAVCYRLMGEVVVPVVAPSLLGPGKRLERPEDIGKFRLLQHVTRPLAWQEWLEACGVSSVDGHMGPRFEQFHMVIQAAVAGFGVALLPAFLIQEELATGKLVIAIDRPVVSRYAYYFVHPEEKAGHRGVVAFRDWLLALCARGQGSQGGDADGNESAV